MLQHHTASLLTWYRITGVSAVNPHWTEIAFDHERSPHVIATAVMRDTGMPFELVDLLLSAIETRRVNPESRLPLPAYEETVCRCRHNLSSSYDSYSE